MDTRQRVSSTRSPLGPIFIAIIAGSMALLFMSWPLLFTTAVRSPEDVLPVLNTSLILISGVCLLLGRFFIAQGQVTYHKRSMLTAAVFAALFLIFYVIRWAVFGAKGFTGEGWVRTFYLSILISHTLLAMAIGPLVLVTLRRALRADFINHRRIARLTFPLWLYVVVTGWVIYWMLYRL